MKNVDMIALAGLMHDIGKFGQRAEIEFKDSVYKQYDYRYTHARYTAQILHELNFNLGDDFSDASATHHNPKDDLSWIIASADRMASGFEREQFEEYNEKSDKEDFKKQRLWYLFNENKRYKIDVLKPENIMPEDNKVVTNEYKELWEKFESDLKNIKEKGKSVVDSFTIDYILKKYTSFIPSSTTFKLKDYNPVKANIPLYEHSKATAVFSSVIYKLYKKNNQNIINYYKDKSGDMEQNDMLLIAGDFFGIQKFIFDSVPTAKASKILRAKSAYIQILTKIIAFYIVDKLELSHQSIITTNAGKFEILGVNDDETKEKLKEIQKELDNFFIKEYFGESGLGVSSVECSLADFTKKDRYKNSLRESLSSQVEKDKFKKFKLREIDPVLKYDEDINNQNLCELCNKRKKIDDESCESCSKFVKIGEYLAKSSFMTISKGSGQIPIIADYYINFSDEVKRIDNAIAIYDIQNDEVFRGYAKWELKSYVKTDEENKVITFEDLAKSSVKEGKKDGKREHGVEALIALKGDVDGMGNFIKDKNSQVTNSFARYNFFSRMIDYFFSVKASKMMEGRDLYTVFAGGDDIFVLGAWDEVIEFAKELREEFVKFANGSDLTLSVGMVMTKSNKPINFVADTSEKALEKAKEIDKKKDAVSLFGETVKWDKYVDEDNAQYFLEELEYFDENYIEINTGFLYRLLEFIQMSKESKNNPLQTIWKSKLAYSFSRNILEKVKNDSIKLKEAKRLLAFINNMIEKEPEISKMILSEFIYKRRIV